MHLVLELWLAAGSPSPVNPTPSASASVPVWGYILAALGIGGIITAIVTYVGRKRETSGRIDTTEAAKLWDEATIIRGELRDELVEVRKEKDELAGKVDLLTRQMETIRDKHTECQKNEALLKIRVDQLEATIERRHTASRKAATTRRQQQS